jgi:S1-C subfamily serine protease
MTMNRLLLLLAILAAGLATSPGQSVAPVVFGVATIELKNKPEDPNWVSAGSGFFVKGSNSLFLVTAAHVIWDGKSPFRVTNLITATHSAPYEPGKRLMILTTDLPRAYASGDLKRHPSRDVAALRIWEIGEKSTRVLPHTRQQHDREIGEMPRVELSDIAFATRFADVGVGDEVYLVGFPRSLGMRNARQVGPTDPLLRRSIIAGKNPDAKTLIIDGSVYPGNSGGPVWRVIQRDLQTRSFSLAGVAIQLIPFDERLLLKDGGAGFTNGSWAVSAYSVVEPVDAIAELLETFGTQ